MYCFCTTKVPPVQVTCCCVLSLSGRPMIPSLQITNCSAMSPSAGPRSRLSTSRDVVYCLTMTPNPNCLHLVLLSGFSVRRTAIPAVHTLSCCLVSLSDGPLYQLSTPCPHHTTNCLVVWFLCQTDHTTNCPHHVLLSGFSVRRTTLPTVHTMSCLVSLSDGPHYQLSTPCLVWFFCQTDLTTNCPHHVLLSGFSVRRITVPTVHTTCWYVSLSLAE